MSSVSFDDVVEVLSFYLISAVEELDITSVSEWGPPGVVVDRLVGKLTH